MPFIEDIGWQELYGGGDAAGRRCSSLCSSLDQSITTRVAMQLGSHRSASVRLSSLRCRDVEDVSQGLPKTEHYRETRTATDNPCIVRL